MVLQRQAAQGFPEVALVKAPAMMEAEANLPETLPRSLLPSHVVGMLEIGRRQAVPDLERCSHKSRHEPGPQGIALKTLGVQETRYLSPLGPPIGLVEPGLLCQALVGRRLRGERGVRTPGPPGPAVQTGIPGDLCVRRGFRKGFRFRNGPRGVSQGVLLGLDPGRAAAQTGGSCFRTFLGRRDTPATCRISARLLR
jgi:hypothetical protein